MSKITKRILFFLFAWLFVAGVASPLQAIQVDVSTVYYTDSQRTVNYDFVSGSKSGDVITIPASYVTKPAGESSLSYTFGLYPGTTGLSLSWTASNPCVLQTPSGRSHGAAVIGTTPSLPDPASAQTSWTYMITLQNFNISGSDAGITNRVHTGMGSDAGGDQPKIVVSWLPNGNLQMVAQVGDSGSVWKSGAVTLTGLTPSATTLKLRVRNTGTTITFSYYLNGGALTLIDTFAAADGYVAANYKGFPVLFPFVNLERQDTFHAFSFHQQSDGKYYAAAFVKDPDQAIYSSILVSKNATCGAALTNVSLDYNNGEWWLPTGVDLGTAVPSCFSTFTFNTVKKAGGTDLLDRTVAGYVQDFATNLQPAGYVVGNPTISWTGIAGASQYHIQVYEPGGFNQIWSGEANPDESSIDYSGPALVSGTTYRYSVISNIETNGQDNNSMVDGSFIYIAEGTTVTVTGLVRNFFGGVISGPGVTVSRVGGGASTTSDESNGIFSLSGIPAGTPFLLKLSRAGYIDLYSQFIRLYTNTTINYDGYGWTYYALPTAANLSAYGAAPDAGKAVIFGRVSDSTYRAGANVGGAVVTATGSSKSYPVTYYSPFGVLGGTSTYHNGTFYVLNVDPADTIVLQASKPGWTFSNSATFYTTADSANSTRLYGISSGYDVSMSGAVRNSGGTSLIADVRMELNGDSGKFTTTDVNGAATLTGLPRDATFYLRFTKTGYLPSYAGPITRQSSAAGIDFRIYTAADFSSLGITGSNSLLTGFVCNQAAAGLNGATVTLTSKFGNSYVVHYTGGGSSTSAAGTFYIPDVVPGDVVEVQVRRPGYVFTPIYMDCFTASATGKYFVGTVESRSDVNADGISDIFLRNNGTGDSVLWFMNNNGTKMSDKIVFTDPNSTIIATGDFNNDGISDLIKRNATTGQTVVWFMNADGTRAGFKNLFTDVNSTVIGTGDFNADGICDLIKRDTVTGQSVLWFMNADGSRASYKVLFTDVNSTIAGTGDFNGDGICDLIKRSTNGQSVLWFMRADGTRASYKIILSMPVWSVAGTGDINGDGITDIIWKNTSNNQHNLWLMNADGTHTEPITLLALVNWSMVGTGDFNRDGLIDLLWRSTGGLTRVWFMNADGSHETPITLLNDPNWTVVGQ